MSKGHLYHSMNVVKFRLSYLAMIASVFFILLAPIGQVVTIKNALAQLGPLGQLNQSAVVFRNVVVGADPGPNKPFKVNATISVSDILPRHVLLSLSVPKEISISGSPIADLGDMSSRDGERSSSWTLVAAASGSFPLNITGYSSSISISNINNNFQSTSFPFNVSIGSQIVSSIRPFNILLAGAELPSSVVGPGDKNLPLNITLVNDGTLPLSDITATLQLSEPFYWSYNQNSTNAVESHTEIFHSGSVTSGHSMIATYLLSIRKSATPGTYMNNLRVSFSDGKQHHQLMYDLAIPVSFNTAISIVTHSAKITPDYYSPITFEIINKGGVPLHALQVTSPPPSSVSNAIPASSTASALQAASRASVTSNSPRNPYYTVGTPYWIGDLGVGDNKSVTLQVYAPHETLTQEPLPITLTYDADGKHLTDTHLIGVQIQGNPAFQIQTVRVSPVVSFPGDVNTAVTMNVLNSGFGIANNVTTLLKLPSGLTPSFGNANVEYFGRVLPNQNFTATYFLNINPNTLSGTYPLTLSTSYYNNKNDNGRTLLNSNFLVSPKAKFEMLGTGNSGQLYAGATNVPFQVTIRNVGTAMAQTITAKFLGGNTIPGARSPLETGTGNTENVGNVVPGQIFTTTFIVNPASSTAGRQYGAIELDWTQPQTNGVTQTNTFVQTIPITYDVSQGPNYLIYYYGIPLTYVAIAVVLTIVLIIFIIFRQRRIHRTNLYLQRQPPNHPPDNGPVIESPHDTTAVVHPNSLGSSLDTRPKRAIDFRPVRKDG